MSSLSGLGIGLGVMFGCFLVAMIAEIYYVFWWRKGRRINSASQDHEMDGDDEDSYTSKSSSMELFYLLCWRKNHGGSISTRALNTDIPSEVSENRFVNDDGDCHVFPTSPESHLNSEFVTKFWPLQTEGMDSELMRIHSLLGPPRILFTIKEETKEDMESEDGKSRGGKSKRGSHSRSLSDMLSQIGSEFGGGSIICPSPAETPPFITPSSSPPFHTPFSTPPLTPLNHHYPHPSHNKSKSFDAFQKSPSPIDDVAAAVDGGNLNQDKKQGAVALEIDDGPLNSSPALSGDENASFITILVNDDTYKLKG